MKIAVKTLENKEAGQIELDPAVFGVAVREDILLACVRYQMNNRRAGTHKTKGISEVSGTGKKPYKQKGTGSARQGSLRSAQFRGGATIFGPVVRSHATDLPKKVRRLGLRTALSAKAAKGQLIIIDEAKAKTHKTKAMAETFEKLGVVNALIVTGKARDENFSRATGNLKLVDVLTSEGANVYDILRREKLVLTKDAVNELTERLKD